MTPETTAYLARGSGAFAAPLEAGDILPLRLAGDPRQAGGKASALSRIVPVGLPVPDGVVIACRVLERWLDDSGLRLTIEKLLPPADADAATRRLRTESIRDLVAITPLTPHLAAVLERVGAQMLPGAPLAVRSSAVGEDGASASFAGQFDSVLHVNSADSLQEAVLTCWASLWSERVVSYRRSRGIAPSGMAVLVQRQVDAAESGVLFTRHPIEGPAFLLVESCPGLADALVLGRADPVRRTLARGDAERDELGRAGLLLERTFGCAQDIEWSRDRAGTLWIVQSRPITVAQPAIPRRETVVWSNANVCENFPGLISPLLHSIASAGYYHYFRNLALAFGISPRRVAAMEIPLRGIIGVHAGRMYYNLSNIHAVIRLAPLGERLAEAFNRFVGANEMTSAQGAPPPASPWEHIRVVLCVVRQYAVLPRRIARFEAAAGRFAAATHSSLLRGKSVAELAADLRAFLDIRQHRWKDASLADAGAMATYAALQRLLAAAGAAPGSHNRLLRALPGVPSSLPPLRLWDLSRVVRANPDLAALFRDASSGRILARVRADPKFADFRTGFERYLEDWGFRSSGELMLTVPSLPENPLPLIDLLRQYAAGDGASPAIAIAAQAAERSVETSRLLRGLLPRRPVLALALRAVLRATQSCIGFRERARLKQALLYNRCRLLALELGQRWSASGLLEQADDVFMLTWQEIDDLAAGRAFHAQGAAALAGLRRRQQVSMAALTPPDRFELPVGQQWSPAAGGKASKPGGAESHAGEGRTDVLCGTGASGGRVRGRAAVLGDIAEADKLQAGDILVTRQTDPGWGPVFCLVRGLVIERGGMLSHGAIIAREFGLPCVVGIADAASRIPHGTQVEVDGDRGTCELLRAGAEADLR